MGTLLRGIRGTGSMGSTVQLCAAVWLHGRSNPGSHKSFPLSALGSREPLQRCSMLQVAADVCMLRRQGRLQQDAGAAEEGDG
jgi:hypothetical protein